MKVGDFGVAHPIPNNRFRACVSESTTITSISSNVITVTVTGKRLPSDLDRYFGKSVEKCVGGHINKVILGPSTHSLNVGAMEVLPVKSATGLTITVLEAINYSYSSGDDITLIGIGLPFGWHESVLDMVHYNDFPFGSILSINGYSDQYLWDIVACTSGSHTKACYLKTPPIINNTYYRLSVNYKLINLSSTQPVLGLYDNSDINSNWLNLSLPASTSWSSVSGVAKTIPVSEEKKNLVVSLNFVSSTTFDRLSISGIALTHTMHYVDEYTSATLSDIGEYPRLGSVKVRRFVDTGKVVKNIDGLPYRSNFLNKQWLPVTRYSITYDIHDATQIHLDQLKGLLEMQERGWLLNHFPEVPGLPYVMAGRIKINRRRYQVHDFSRMNFQLIFEEIIL